MQATVLRIVINLSRSLLSEVERDPSLSAARHLAEAQSESVISRWARCMQRENLWSRISLWLSAAALRRLTLCYVSCMIIAIEWVSCCKWKLGVQLHSNEAVITCQDNWNDCPLLVWSPPLLCLELKCTRLCQAPVNGISLFLLPLFRFNNERWVQKRLFIAAALPSDVVLRQGECRCQISSRSTACSGSCARPPEISLACERLLSLRPLLTDFWGFRRDEINQFCVSVASQD